MKQSQLSPPQQPRPWYYQRWFLVPAFILGWPLAPLVFVLWPVWGVLVLRSPWHNGILFRSLAWAMLFSGVVAVWWLVQSGTAGANIGAFILPGLVLTGVTQIMWVRHRRELLAVGQQPAPSPGLERAPSDGPPPRPQQPRLPRRSRARGRPRPGRYSRHPR